MDKTSLELYNKVRSVPIEAQKKIGGGRLKGMTDINPMWRIKKLTEEFGVCGFGWYYEIVEKWIETSMAKDEITANIKINLYIKQGDEWSKPIQGIGGSMLVASEKNGLYVNDECYKMALTDAISVACKALGMGADIYWGSDNTKYTDGKRDSFKEKKPQNNDFRVDKTDRDSIINSIVTLCDIKRYNVLDLCSKTGVDKLEDMTDEQLSKWIDWLESK